MKRAAKHSSIGLGLLAGLLTGAEAVVQTIGVDKLPIPTWARAVVILLVIGGAFLARWLAQRGEQQEDGDAQ